jgi:uncharacterized protein with NRDE domain
MCIAAFALDVGPYAAVIISNRDEWLHRPAQAMDWWPDQQTLAGKDLSAGGTWLGLNKAGRFAMITNIRGSSLDEKQYAQSRGKLPLAWLNAEHSLEVFSRLLIETAQEYAGYNIIYGDLKAQALLHYNNQEGVVSRLETKQIHGISNASLDTPWPKLVRLKASLESSLATQAASDTGKVCSELFQALADKTSFDYSPLSAINVDIDDFHGTGRSYGWRCSTVILVRRDGLIRVEEAQRAGTSQSFSWQL